MRAFVAIDPPAAVRDALELVQDALPPGLGRLADPDQLHLTLAFLGERPDEEIEAAHEALEGLRHPAFTLAPGGLGTFGARVPEVVWAGVRDAPSTQGNLASLQAKVRSALHGAGIVLERKRFRPHVTLARLGRTEPAALERLAAFLARWDAFPSPPWEVQDLALWRSILRPSGAIHEELARYRLG